MSDATLGTVTAKVTADTTDFDAKMQKASATLTATSRANEAASRKAAQAAAFAAKFAGDAVSEQSLRQVEGMKAVAAANADLRKAQQLAKLEYGGQAAAVNLVAAAQQRLTTATRALNSETEHNVSQMMAASAAIRTLEGNPGIRTIERFASSFPVIAAGFSALFPVIGFAATAAAVAHIGTEFYDTEQKAKHAAQTASREFSDLALKMKTVNDELDLTNSKLSDDIAKLEKHPSNGIESSLLAAVVAADKLQASLVADLKAFEALNDKPENAISFSQSLISGKGSTGDAQKEIAEQRKAFEDNSIRLGATLGTAMLAAGADPQKQQAATKAYYDSMDSLAADAARKMRKRATDIADDQRRLVDAGHLIDIGSGANRGSAGGDTGSVRDLSRRRDIFEQGAVVYDQIQHRVGSDATAFQDEKKKASLEGAKADAADVNKASEQRLKAMQAALNLQKLQYGISVKAEYDYWDLRRAAFAKGSEQYDQIVEKQATLAEEGARKAAESIKRYKDEQKSQAAEGSTVGLDIARTNSNMARDRRVTLADSADATRQLAAVKQRVAMELEEQRVQAAAGRTMTQYAAAARLAEVHTAGYGAELDRLVAKQREVAASIDLTDDQKAKQLGQLAEQQASLEGGRQLQVMRDAAANDHSGSLASVGFVDALDEFVQSARDNAQAMKALTASTISSTNETILRQITGRGQRGDWTRLGQSVFTGIAGAGLNKAEGALLSGLGFGGKADGKSESSALWVRMAGMASKVSSTAGSAISSAVSGGGGMIGKFASSLLSSVPFFADGVDNFGGGMAVVGDAGPELLNLPRGSSVIPNSKAFGGGGGDTHHHTWNIDARGSHDPAQVNRQIMAAAPHIAAAAVKAVDERSRRRPSSMR